MKMQRSKFKLGLTLFVLCWTLSCFDIVGADGITRSGKTTNGLRRQSDTVDRQRAELQGEDSQLDEPSTDMEGKTDKPRSKKSPEEVLAGK